MLKELRLTGVGPAEQMDMAFADRLNIITGDNGLGKSFILDVAWWALTRTWAGATVRPVAAHLDKARIGFSYDGKSKAVQDECIYDRKQENWKRALGRPSNPGLVLYARSDGGFSVWDPARNYWKDPRTGEQNEKLLAYIFSPQEVWDGLPLDGPKKYCNGLIADWAAWQREAAEPFNQLLRALEALSPERDELLKPGKLVRLPDDVRYYPTVSMSYGMDVPVVHLSSGMRRIIALAYLLVWGWQEHLIAAERRGEEPTRQIVFLIDEIESHLHPKWQRQIFESVLAVMNALIGKSAQVNVQIIAATHSPMVLASLEPIFDPAKDQLFDFDLKPDEQNRRRVVLEPRHWEKLGTVDKWLVSNIFDFKEARSHQAETLVREIHEAMRSGKLSKKRAKELDRQLDSQLGETDPLWLRWRYFAERKGWLAPETGSGDGHAKN